MRFTCAKTLAFSVIAILVAGGCLAGRLLPSEAVVAVFVVVAVITGFAAICAVITGYVGFAVITWFAMSAGFAVIAGFSGFAVIAVVVLSVAAFAAVLISNEEINNYYARKGK